MSGAYVDVYNTQWNTGQWCCITDGGWLGCLDDGTIGCNGSVCDDPGGSISPGWNDCWSSVWDPNAGSCVEYHDDCDICGGDNASKDDCGVCGGNGSTCGDCDGTTNNVISSLDDCGVCGGNGSSCGDCDGTNNIITVIDACNVCGGNNAAMDDCGDCWGGNAAKDDCGVCDGNGSSCGDCDGKNGTITFLDDCDVCGGNGTTCGDCDGINNIITTFDDCNDCGGNNAAKDDCGVCDGDGSSCGDCDGVANGLLITNDDCGICNGDGSTCSDCDGKNGIVTVLDECGECGGSGYIDECSVCDDDPTNDCIKDCNNEWGGNSICLSIGNINYETSSLEIFYQSNDPISGFQFTLSDNDQKFNFNSAISDLGYVAVGNNNFLGVGLNGEELSAGSGLLATIYFTVEPNITTQTCIDNIVIGYSGGIQYPVLIEDNCIEVTCLADCAGTCYGDAVLDNCNTCDNDPNNDCIQDCNEDWGGSAYVDNCNNCVSGNTGNTECVQDCTEFWGGNAVCLSIGNIDNDNGNLEILYESQEPIAGFQFELSGPIISSASTDLGYIITQPNSSLLIGLGMNGELLPPGSGVLANINFDPSSTDIISILNNIVISFAGGVEPNEPISSVPFVIAECANADECGECGGDGLLDNCGICDADSSNDCIQDCNNVWGGDGLLDNCNVCDNDPLNDCTQDCENYWGGDAVCLSIVNIDSDNGSLKIQYESQGPIAGFQFELSGLDIISIFSDLGEVTTDSNSNLVVGFGINGELLPAGSGILAEINFNPVLSDISTCLTDGIIAFIGGTEPSIVTCPLECSTILGCSNADDCNVCGGDGSTCGDCDGINNIITTLDDCSVCGGNNASMDDCGVCEGNNASMDDCGECDGNGSTCGDCDSEANGIISSFDDCGECGGNGSTCGDCDGVNNMITTFDECGVCGGSGPVECVNGDFECNEDDCPDTIDYCLSLHSGANLISFYGLPIDASLTNVVSSLGSLVTGIITEGGASSQSESVGWIGSISDISKHKGYWIIMSEARDLCITEALPNTTSLIYDLHAGANLISFPVNGSIGVSESIPDSIEDSITAIVTEGAAAQQLELGGWVGSITNFSGGRGYWIIASDPISLSYNLTALIRIKEISVDRVPIGYEYNQSTQQAFYFIESVEKIEVGDWLIAYHGNNLIGARIWTGEIIDIPVMGNDGHDFTSDYINTGNIPDFKLLKQDRLISLVGDIPAYAHNTLYNISRLQILPDNIKLFSAYPNPFNPITTLDFTLPQTMDVSIIIYDMQGRVISNLISGVMQSGYHTVSWDAEHHSTGLYFVQMVVGDFSSTQKLVVIK